MNKFEYEHRQELENRALSSRRRQSQLADQGKSHTPLYGTLEQAHLDEWDSHVVQIMPAPAGLHFRVWAEVSSGRCSRKHYDIPVLCLGLTRSGKVEPMVLEEFGAILMSDMEFEYLVVRDGNGQNLCGCPPREDDVELTNTPESGT